MCLLCSTTASISAVLNPVQLGLVLGHCSREPGDDGVGEDRLNDDGVELSHHRPQQPTFFKLPEEEHPHVGLFQKGRDIRLPLQVPGDGQA